MDELIYDRTQSDVDYAINNPQSSSFLKGAYNYVDLNRIENWCAYIAEQLNSYNYSVSIETKTDWLMSDFPTKTQMKRIRDNVERLKNAFTAITEVPSNMDKMTYKKANDLERVLYEINKFIANMESSFIYSDEVFAGEV